MKNTKEIVNLKELYGFNSLDELDEETADEFIATHCFKQFATYEEFEKDLIEKIEIGLEQVRTGQGRPMEEFFQEFKQKYNIKEL